MISKEVIDNCEISNGVPPEIMLHLVRILLELLKCWLQFYIDVMQFMRIMGVHNQTFYSLLLFHFQAFI